MARSMREQLTLYFRISCMFTITGYLGKSSPRIRCSIRADHCRWTSTTGYARLQLTVLLVQRFSTRSGGMNLARRSTPGMSQTLRVALARRDKKRNSDVASATAHAHCPLALTRRPDLYQSQRDACGDRAAAWFGLICRKPDRTAGKWEGGA